MCKDLFNSVIIVLDNLPEKGRIFNREQGIKLLGNPVLWNESHKWISQNIPHGIIFPGVSDLSVQNPEGIALFRQRLVNKVKAIEESEYAARLQIEESRSNIRSARHGIIVSYAALVISILATTPLPGHLYRWIRELIAGLF